MRYLIITLLTQVGKVGTILTTLIFIIFCSVKGITLVDSWGWLANVAVLGVLLIIFKWIMGGFLILTKKSMYWAIALSTVAALILFSCGISHGNASASYWLMLFPISIGGILAYYSYRFLNDTLDDDSINAIDGEAIVDSIFDYGLKKTFQSFIGEYEDNEYYSMIIGVKVYTNVSFLIGLILMMIYF